MLSPIDASPKGKAPSIWSFDSGYGSNTIEEEDYVCACMILSKVYSAAADLSQTPPQPSSSTEQRPTGSRLTPAGLGISGIGDFWNVHVEDKLRLRRPDLPVVPITTKLNVFTTRDTSTAALPRSGPTHSESPCITCSLWDLTNPREGLKCDGCKSKDYVRPEVLTLFDIKSITKPALPRLETPSEPRTRHSLEWRNKARCSACELAHAIEPKALTACASCARDPGLLSPASPVTPSTVKRSCARRHTKLPSHALHHLRTWLRANRDHPYPNLETKRELAQECGLTEKQVTTWFTNTRARKLILPNDRSHTSSEDEGPYESDFSSTANLSIRTTSPVLTYDTSNYPVSTPISGSAAYSHTPSTVQTSRRGKKKDYRRTNTLSPMEESPVPRTPIASSPNLASHEQETWQCTFCYQHLVPKSWRRHEETQHRPKYQWTCLATGPRLTVSSRVGTSSMCAFCNIKDPSNDHLLHSHRIMECSKKSEADRTFGRPDHLRQHIKNFHKASMLDYVRDMWRKDRPRKNVNERWSCGFCKAELNTWDMRETHIANHFKDGLTLAAWKDAGQSTTPESVTDRRPSLCQEHATVFPRLRATLTGHSHRQPCATTLDPLLSSSNCSDISLEPVLLGYSETGFEDYVPSAFTNEFDYVGPSADSNFESFYSATSTTPAIYYGDETLPMGFDAATNAELYGNPLDFQEFWDMG
jgi:hypothetical protein